MKVLAVDDREEIAKILLSIFRAELWEATVTATAAEFRARLCEADYDICLIDIGLPDDDGFQLVPEVRGKSDAGIIVLTGRGSEVDQVLGLESGADDYIVKPFRKRELVARIRSVARRRSRGEPEAGVGQIAGVQSVFGYQVDPNAKSVVGPDGQEIALTNAEFDLLSLLVSRRGLTVGRDEAAQAVRGSRWHISDRSMDGLVSRLRKKLPLSGSHHKSLIKTLHGKGYMLPVESD